MNDPSNQAEVILAVSSDRADKFARRFSRRLYVAEIALLSFVYLVLLSLSLGAPRESLLGTVFVISLVVLPFITAFLFMVPRLYARFFNGFAVYSDRIQPPVRHVTSIPSPPLVSGWSMKRFIRAARARFSGKPLVIPYTRIRAFEKVRGWEDSFLFDIVTDDDLRIRLAAPEIQDFYVPKRTELREVYEILEAVRNQVNEGKSIVTIDSTT